MQRHLQSVAVDCFSKFPFDAIHSLPPIVTTIVIVICTVQIVVGSFDADGKKEPKQQKLAPSPSDPSPAPLKLAPPTTGVAAGPSSPPSRGTLSLSESSGGAPSPPHAGASGGHGQQQPGGFSGLSWK
jgi:hypothetical protein